MATLKISSCLKPERRVNMGSLQSLATYKRIMKEGLTTNEKLLTTVLSLVILGVGIFVGLSVRGILGIAAVVLLGLYGVLRFIAFVVLAPTRERE